MATQILFLILVLVLFVGQTNTSKSQNNTFDDLTLSAGYHHGLVIPEYQNFNYVVNDYVRGFTLNVAKQTRGKDIWEQLYNYPAFGMAFYYGTLGNDQVHGQEYAIYPYYNLFIVKTRRFGFFHQIGVGLGYVTKKFDLNKNYLNVAVGSHLNIHFNTRFGIYYKIYDQLGLSGGISFDHFSNGNFQEPNLGINAVTAYGGVNYLLGSERPVVIKELPKHNPGLYYEIIYSFGGKHARALADEIYFTSSVTCEVKWKKYRRFHFGLGGDLFYDASTEVEMEILRESGYKSLYDYRTGFHLSQELVYNRLSLILQEGVYLGLTDHVGHNVMYNRGIIRYRFTEHVFGSIAMKSHLHILDYAEIGIGYIIK